MAQQSLDDTVALLCEKWLFPYVLRIGGRAEEMSREIETVRAKEVGVSRGNLVHA